VLEDFGQFLNEFIASSSTERTFLGVLVPCIEVNLVHFHWRRLLKELLSLLLLCPIRVRDLLGKRASNIVGESEEVLDDLSMDFKVESIDIFPD